MQNPFYWPGVAKFRQMNETPGQFFLEVSINNWMATAVKLEQ